MNFAFRPDLMMEVLPIMGTGMLGIFIVTGVIIGVVTLSEEFAPTINTYNEYWLYADTSSGTVYLPSAVWPTAYRFDEPQNVAIKVENTDVMTTVGQKAAEILTEGEGT